MTTTSHFWRNHRFLACDAAFVLVLVAVPSLAPADGTQLQVNTQTTGNQYAPDVAVATDGSILVVWSSASSAGTDLTGTSVQGRLLHWDGTFVGSDIQLNTYTQDDQKNPAIAADPAGGFLVVWSSEGSLGDDQDSKSIQSRRFDTSGAASSVEQQVNTVTTAASTTRMSTSRPCPPTATWSPGPHLTPEGTIP